MPFICDPLALGQFLGNIHLFDQREDGEGEFGGLKEEEPAEVYEISEYIEKWNLH